MLIRCLLVIAAASPLAAQTFEKTVQPVLGKTCAPCHNEQLASGGLNIAGFTKASSLASDRDGWDAHPGRSCAPARCRRKGVPRPAGARRAPFNTCRANSTRPTGTPSPIPAASPRAASIAPNTPTPSATCWASTSAPRRAFPTDDLGNGFDNIGDVLTISPVLMEKYLAAAGDIAAARDRRRPAAQEAARSRSITLKDKQDPPRRSEHHRSHAPHRVRRRIHRPLRPARRARGRRQARSSSASGWTASCSTPSRSRPSRPGWSTSIRTPKSRCACYLPEGDHVFRAGFIDDDFVKTLDAEGRSTTARRTSSSTRSRSSGRSRPRSRRPAARRF